MSCHVIWAPRIYVPNFIVVGFWIGDHHQHQRLFFRVFFTLFFGHTWWSLCDWLPRWFVWLGAATHSMEKCLIRLQLKHLILFLSTTFFFPPCQLLKLPLLLEFSCWSWSIFPWSWLWMFLPKQPLEFIPWPRPRKFPWGLWPPLPDVWAYSAWLSPGFSEPLSISLCLCASREH